MLCSGLNFDRFERLHVEHSSYPVMQRVNMSVWQKLIFARHNIYRAPGTYFEKCLWAYDKTS